MIIEPVTKAVANDMGLGDAIVYVADKIGISVQHMYEIMIHAQVTMAILNIVLMVCWCVIVAVTAVITYRTIVKPHLNDKGYSSDIGMRWIVMAGVTAIVALLAIFPLTILQSSLVAIFCPEYSALKEMLYTFKNIL